ncbi:hypothetical protein E5D57_012429 [Metarhizium anisopliae]|nr:hypothetical protein E5D57_012429 [Metarhizium anisopliae]
MASRREIADTLAAIGCNNNAVQCILDENSKSTHLFPGHLFSDTPHVEDILSHQASQNIAKQLFLLQALHAALDDTDQILTAKTNVRHQMDDEELASSSVSRTVRVRRRQKLNTLPNRDNKASGVKLSKTCFGAIYKRPRDC